MSKRSHSRNVRLFEALADRTRLDLIDRLCGGERRSITDLSAGSTMTRQAVTKHLRVLEKVGLVRALRSGRERLYGLEPKPLDDARKYLELISRRWDEALARLKAFVEGPA